MHLVVYVTIWIDGSQLNVKNADAVTVVEQLMVDAAERWDQNHPGIPGSSGLAKNYAVVCRKEFKDDSTVIKVRHIFGRRSEQGSINIVVQIDTQPGRASSGSRMRLYCQTGPNGDVPPNPAWLQPDPATEIPGAVIPSRRYEFEPNGSEVTDSFDEATFDWFTFAHELGHECGLPDEYLENIDAEAILPGATGALPRFNQFGPRRVPTSTTNSQ